MAVFRIAERISRWEKTASDVQDECLQCFVISQDHASLLCVIPIFEHVNEHIGPATGLTCLVREACHSTY